VIVEKFDGKTFDQARDGKRLTSQLNVVKALMLRGGWVSLKDLAALTGYPEASVSARLRDLRKERFGGYNVERVYLSHGLWLYRVDA
jgi:DNA-binding IclR family transcriptional regulator